MNELLMECGHVANAQTGSGWKCCAMCIGIHPGATKIAATKPDLTGRESRCPHCKTLSPSSYGLPFFEHRPDMDVDCHYCGCRGWD